MGHKKKKRLSPRQRRKLFFRRNVCWVLPVLCLLLIQRWSRVIHVLLLSLPLCFVWREIFLWREDTQHSTEEKRILLLARIWRYEWIALLPLAYEIEILLCPGRWPHHYFYLPLGYGIYTIVIALSKCRHFVCGMQDIAHRPMRPYARPMPGDCRQGVLLGLCFAALGIWGLVVI